MTWILWGFMLILQNAAHTASSRARNSKSLRYSTVASVFSNGIWIISQFFTVNLLVDAKGNVPLVATIAVLYVTLTTFGSVTSHWFLLRWESRKGL